MRRIFHDVNQQKYVQKENSQCREKFDDVHAKPGYRISPENASCAHTCASQGVIDVNFSGNFAYVLNG